MIIYNVKAEGPVQSLVTSGSVHNLMYQSKQSLVNKKKLNSGEPVQFLDGWPFINISYWKQPQANVQDKTKICKR